MKRLSRTCMVSIMRKDFQAASLTKYFVVGALLISLGALLWPDVAVNSQSGALTAEDNTNRRGGDYKEFEIQNNWTLCRDACANDGNCQAYTFVRPGVQGPNARCWLKSSIPAGERDNCCISGARGGGGSGTGDGGASPVTAEDNTNRRGGDYKAFDLSQNIWTLCRDACANDGNCKAYTFVRAGAQTPNAKCWLKNSVPAGERDNCCISGVRTGGGGNTGGGSGTTVGGFSGEWDTSVPGAALHLSLSQGEPNAIGDFWVQGVINGNRGTIGGILKGRTLRFQWTYEGAKGAGHFVLSDDGKTFNGFFSDTNDPENRSRGFWNGKRPVR